MRRLGNIRLVKRWIITTITLTALVVVGVIWWQKGHRKPAVPAVIKPVIVSPTPAVTASVFSADYVLGIDKLSLHAPIVPNVPGTNEKAYLAALTNGVAHYAGTPLPGQKVELSKTEKKNGNTFIFGHSSFYKSQPYNTVFAKLDQLKIGDTFAITVHNKDVLTYRVFRSAIVKDDDLSILAPDKSGREIVTLMTCWPPGTIARRYIIQAERMASSSPTASPLADLPKTSNVH